MNFFYISFIFYFFNKFSVGSGLHTYLNYYYNGQRQRLCLSKFQKTLSCINTKQSICVFKSKSLLSKAIYIEPRQENPNSIMLINRQIKGVMLIYCCGSNSSRACRSTFFTKMRLQSIYSYLGWSRDFSYI